MADERRPLFHLARAIDELVRAGSQALDLALERSDAAWLENLRAAVRLEVARWEPRAETDPAARRVYDLFRALLDVLETEREARVDPDETPGTPAGGYARKPARARRAAR